MKNIFISLFIVILLSGCTSEINNSLLNSNEKGQGKLETIKEADEDIEKTEENKQSIENVQEEPDTNFQKFKNVYYHVIGDAVFYEEEKINGVNISTFEIMKIGNGLLARDKNAVYSRGIRLENSDHDTFELLEYPYTKDKNNVYYDIGNLAGDNWQGILGADPKTFEMRGRGLAKDSKNFYFYAETIPNAIENNFEILSLESFYWVEKGYAKDDNFLYRLEEPNLWIVKNVEGLDFHFINDDYARSKNHFYKITKEDEFDNKYSFEEIFQKEPIKGEIFAYFMENYGEEGDFEVNKKENGELYIVARFFNTYTCAGPPSVSPFWEVGCCHHGTIGICDFPPREQPILRGLEDLLKEKFQITYFSFSHGDAPKEYWRKDGEKIIKVYENGSYLIGHSIISACNRDDNLGLFPSYGFKIIFEVKDLLNGESVELKECDYDSDGSSCKQLAKELKEKYDLNSAFSDQDFSFSQEVLGDSNITVNASEAEDSQSITFTLFYEPTQNSQFLLSHKEIVETLNYFGFYNHKEIPGLSLIYTTSVGSSNSGDMIFVPQDNLIFATSRLYNTVGMEYYSQNDYEKSIEFFQKAVNLDDQYAQAFFNMASVYSLIQQKDKSLENLKKSIEIDSETFKKKAKEDPDFDLIREEEEFKEMVL